MLAPLCRLLKHLRQFQHPLLLTAWLPSATCRPVSGAGLIAQRTCNAYLVYRQSLSGANAHEVNNGFTLGYEYSFHLGP